ncbi:MAG: hypothetical protein KDA77_10895, partial [Planctomycetaceae bacterium]|nr:hypothetical protein [Planctomycetaceae bacterium]
MDDLFATTERRYLPWPLYRELETKAARRTLIDQTDFSTETATARLKDLMTLEQDQGFVYLGERKWLESCLMNHQLSYATWVLNQFNKLFEDGLSQETEETIGTCWRGYTENVGPIWLPEEYSDSTIQFGEINILIPGDDSGPYPDKLCQAFEILHNLCYYLNHAGKLYRETVFLKEIIIHQENQHWTAELCNDYGSVGSVEFEEGEI